MIANTKAFILDAISERKDKDNWALPSVYWSDFARNFQYVYDLSSKELLRIRFHTYHLTSDNYQTYYFADEAYKRLILNGYEYFSNCSDLELVEEGIHGIGVDTRYGKVSHDLLRYMGTVRDLFNSHVLGRNSSKRILEVGGGYGGLARVVLLNAPKSSYFICDLEETIFFSATYLRNTFGAERVHLIDFALTQSDIQEGHIYILPQSRIKCFDGLNFDLVISQQSLQEMTKEQVDKYCAFILSNARKFYSCNLSDHAQIAIDKGLAQDLPKIFEFYFGRPVWVGDFPVDGLRYGDNHLPRALYACESIL
jgi:hypothetical protein